MPLNLLSEQHARQLAVVGCIRGSYAALGCLDKRSVGDHGRVCRSGAGRVHGCPLSTPLDPHPVRHILSLQIFKGFAGPPVSILPLRAQVEEASDVVLVIGIYDVDREAMRNGRMITNNLIHTVAHNAGIYGFKSGVAAIIGTVDNPPAVIYSGLGFHASLVPVSSWLVSNIQ